MFVRIPKDIFNGCINYLDAVITRKTLLNKINMSNQWLYTITSSNDDVVKIKKDKWQAIKELAIKQAKNHQDFIATLKDF